MKLRIPTALAAALLVLAPTVSHAALTAYHQDFETLVMADPAALSNDGWLVYGNVFDPTGVNWIYGYGPFPAPNPGAGFCALVTGQGGTEQGTQQLSVYNDYNNIDHAIGRRIESNVYREQTVSAADDRRHVDVPVRRQARQPRPSPARHSHSSRRSIPATATP